MRDRAPHYIKPAGSTILPRHHLILDVETRPEPVPGGEEHVWRLACTEYLYSHASRGWRPPEAMTHHRPWELWVEVNHRAKPGHRLVIWCHNLAFDLRASSALPFLAALGFECQGIALDAMASWARFSSEDRTIILTDLLSWLPTSLRKVGEDLGIRQLPPPPASGSDELWERRCRRDVEITRTAVVQLLDLVSEQSLGPWRPTGSGQSHSAWKRRFLSHRPLVHDQLTVLGAEREAAWTGRCEAWRWGDIPEGPLTEYDLDLAYCQIGADSRLPSVLVGEIPPCDVDRILADDDDLAVLARVRIDTEIEAVPGHGGPHIQWPVGRFETVLWDPELRMARDTARSVDVTQAWAYRKAPVLRDACEWIIAQLRELAGRSGQIHHRALKHWARALVGRCALRYSDWELWQYAETEDVSLGLVEFREEGVIRESLQIGREVRLLMDRDEAPDSLPQIPGWIMSECRRRLWALMQRAGLEQLVYVDTDSLIVTGEGARRLDAGYGTEETWPMKVKGTYQHAEILGPRCLVLDGQRRAAGIPLTARETPQGALTGHVFVSLRESLMAGSPDRIGLLERSYRLEGIDRRRQHADDGRTLPFVAQPASATIQPTSSTIAAA